MQRHAQHLWKKVLVFEMFQKGQSQSLADEVDSPKTSGPQGRPGQARPGHARAREGTPGHLSRLGQVGHNPPAPS